MLALRDGTVALREWRRDDAPALAAVFDWPEPDARRRIAKAHPPDVRDEGLATAAARLVRQWGFAELGLEQIEVLGDPAGR